MSDKAHARELRGAHRDEANRRRREDRIRDQERAAAAEHAKTRLRAVGPVEDPAAPLDWEGCTS